MKVVITARDFAGENNRFVDMLTKKGFEVIDNGHLGLGIGADPKMISDIVQDADVVIAGLETYNSKVLDACPNLKLISRRGIGYDSVDIEYCKSKNIAVTRTFGMVEGAVAEHVIAYIMYFARNLQLQNEYMQQGKWQRIMMPGAKGRVLGLVGFGGIGKEIAKRAAALGMELIYYCRHPRKEWEEEYKARYCPLDVLISTSDYISVNVPYTKDTLGMFSYEQFAMMKETAVFINIARGQVMNPHDLRRALDEGLIRGAGIDVYDSEPCTDSPLIGCDKVVLTPHTAPYTSENFQEMNRVAAQNVIDFLEDKVNPIHRLV